MGTRSKVRQLPPEIRKKVDEAIAEGRATYDEMVDFLTSEGQEVSRSSLHRYGQSFQESLRQMREGQEMVAAFVRENAQFTELFEGQTGELLRDMFQQIVFRQMQAQIAGGTPTIKAMDLMLLAKTLKEVEGVIKISADTQKRRLEVEAMVNQADAKDKAVAPEADTGPEIDLPDSGR